MKNDAILAQLSEIIRDLADDESIQITEATVAEDVDEWDSLFQVKLMVAVERAFNVKFAVSEINSANNVGELVGQIASKLA